MPITIHPSPASTKLWGSLSTWPFRIDLSIIVVAHLTLLFSLSSGAFECGRQFGDVGWVGVGGAATIIALEIAGPLAAILTSSLNIYLHSKRRLPPGFAVATSVCMLVAWAGGVLLFWTSQVVEPDGEAIYVVRVVKFVGGLGVEVLYFVYIVFSSIATDRLRQHRASNAANSRAEWELELRSQRPSSELQQRMGGRFGSLQDVLTVEVVSVSPLDAGKVPRVVPTEVA